MHIILDPLAILLSRSKHENVTRICQSYINETGVVARELDGVDIIALFRKKESALFLIKLAVKLVRCLLLFIHNTDIDVSAEKKTEPLYFSRETSPILIHYCRMEFFPRFVYTRTCRLIFTSLSE